MPFRSGESRVCVYSYYTHHDVCTAANIKKEKVTVFLKRKKFLQRSTLLSHQMDQEPIFRKKLRLFDDSGREFVALVQAVEYENPYALSVMLMSEDCYARVDVSKADISLQLQLWMEGSHLPNPALFASPQLEEKMNNFIKFGRLPKQSSLVLWILTQCVVRWSPDNAAIIFGTEKIVRDEEPEMPMNPFSSTAEAASDSVSKPNRPSYNRSGEDGDITNTYSITRELLGKSNALQNLKEVGVKGRSDADGHYDRKEWTNDHYRLVGDINKNRQLVEDDMEERRRLLEISKIRQVMTLIGHELLTHRINAFQTGSNNGKI